jgi:hypothetical protein
MRITKLSLIDETEKYYIFSVSFKSFFGEKTKKASKTKNNIVNFSRWMDTGELIYNDSAINAWLTTDKKDFKI